jgi:hypothetical protein
MDARDGRYRRPTAWRRRLVAIVTLVVVAVIAWRR